MEWERPYKLVKAGNVLFVYYDILFEDTVLFTKVSYDNAKRIVGALNGAYNMGRTHERMTKDLSRS